MGKKIVYISFIFCGLAFVNSCRKDIPQFELLPEEGENFPGGSQTSFIQSSAAFGQAMPGLNSPEDLFFFTGNSLFNQNWVTAPASTTARDGLGPTFNARNCSACHFKDGRGKVPNHYDDVSTGFLVRLSIPGTDTFGEPLGDPNYGGQLNDQAILGLDREGQVEITYTEIYGTFADGESYSLRSPSYSFPELNYGPLASNIMVSPRVGQQMIGLGLLEAISENDILANEDINDLNEDGISGKANFVWNYETNQTELGRFGWKANQPTLRQQVAGAFLGDLGITSTIFPNENCPGSQTDCANAPNGGNPEITDENLDKTILYASNLAVPNRPDYKNQDVLRGKLLFNKIDCAKCHKANYTTGNHSTFNNLSNQKIWPYTDLLLHDMGEGLADNRPDFLANGKEWRTPPLWGIGLFETVNGHTEYLHDGRARNLQEAILWHGGEAENSLNQFKNLSKRERNDILQFLKSL